MTTSATVIPASTSSRRVSLRGLGQPRNGKTRLRRVWSAVVTTIEKRAFEWVILANERETLAAISQYEILSLHSSVPTSFKQKQLFIGSVLNFVEDGLCKQLI